MTEEIFALAFGLTLLGGATLSQEPSSSLLLSFMVSCYGSDRGGSNLTE
jgi:hypothetical protein